MKAGGDIALDDIAIVHGSCNTDIGPPSSNIGNPRACSNALTEHAIIILLLLLYDKKEQNMIYLEIIDLHC